jgi:1-acyl-sn-glycerol-3-phosphate acyltransferase
MDGRIVYAVIVVISWGVRFVRAVVVRREAAHVREEGRDSLAAARRYARVRLLREGLVCSKSAAICCSNS